MQQQTIQLKDLSDIELKALGFELRTLQDQTSHNLREIHAELDRRQLAIPASAVTKPVAE